ncbi:hypothetical protein BJ508DRAFT_414712 [Ascobolus immersus RN42]|uniref:BSD domain-containing protein n=1 Tax=Ascobolus immersus RN42 TaxID=1160509 RepID=A0A3N4I5W2_ASCIM|nr:hypothetical protein BJ508DRAFT_414712 [Ascobolus immersus RN42]
MDTAYDHIQESLLPEDEEGKQQNENQPQQSLNAEFEEAYKAISASPWGARLGALVGSVKKQGESYLEASKTEYAHVSEQATKSFAGIASNLVSRTRSLSLVNPLNTPPAAAGSSSSTTIPEGASDTPEGTEPTSERADLKATILSRLRATLAEASRLEAAADQYLDTYANNLAAFLAEAITITPGDAHPEPTSSTTPTTPGDAAPPSTQRKIYTTRLDAQLHLLHTSLDLFKVDPTVPDYEVYSKTFSAEDSTERVARDLEAYPELRATMEALVPADVSYAEFWKRYYFLREQLDAEEQKRKELLKGVQDEEEVGWGDEEEESDEEGDESDEEKVVVKRSSKDTLVPVEKKVEKVEEKEKEEEGKRVSEERAESEMSYDMVSGAPSRAGGSPNVGAKKPVEDDDSDEDWE